MSRRRKVDPACFDLSTRCTACGYAIPPNELVRLDSDRIQCSGCGEVFVPETKGNWSQLGGMGKA